MSAKGRVKQQWVIWIAVAAVALVLGYLVYSQQVGGNFLKSMAAPVRQCDPAQVRDKFKTASVTETGTGSSEVAARSNAQRKAVSKLNCQGPLKEAGTALACPDDCRKKGLPVCTLLTKTGNKETPPTRCMDVGLPTKAASKDGKSFVWTVKVSCTGTCQCVQSCIRNKPTTTPAASISPPASSPAFRL